MFHAERKETWRKEETEHAWSNIPTKSILASPKYAKKAAILIRNTGFLGQLEAKDEG